MANAHSNKWPTNVVVAGAGVAGLEAIIALRALAGDGVNITLLAPEHDFVYRPLSVGEPFALGAATRIPVADLASQFDLELRRDGLASVDTDAHTVELKNGETLHFDKLIVATGARQAPAYSHALTFRGHEDVETVHGLVLDVEGGYVQQLAFVVPTGVAWSLPLYELALMTAQRAQEMSVSVDITFVTPEERPLAVFGPQAGADVGKLLEEAGITIYCSRSTEIPTKGTLVLHPGGEQIAAQRIVTLPVMEGRHLKGLPADSKGFLPIDRHARVGGVADVYAAGDGANFPLKQGGIACQQADAAAEHIAREAGIPIEAHPFRPVLRGKLLTGRDPHYMSHDVSGMTGGEDLVDEHILWWPPTKVAGRYLAPYLAGRETGTVAGQDAGEVGEVELRGYEFASR
jgi:sulfide:quinone oxidoreductase